MIKAVYRDFTQRCGLDCDLPCSETTYVTLKGSKELKVGVHMKPKKQRFEVQEGETIDACLQRMHQLGYMPTKRMEKPVFAEDKQKEPVWIKQQIMFEGILAENEKKNT